MLATLDDTGAKLRLNRSGSGRRSAATNGFFNADNKQFILCDDNVIRTFDADTGQPVLTLRGHDNEIAAIAKSPDGRLWSVETDGTLKQWDLQPIQPVRFGDDFVLGTVVGIAVSADGAWVAGRQIEPVADENEGGDHRSGVGCHGKEVKNLQKARQACRR